MDVRLEGLLVREAIWHCMLRYARGVDRLDEALIRSAYWPDAVDGHGGSCGSLDDFLSDWIPLQSGRDVAFHLLGNHHVALRGRLADAETYFVSAARQRDETAVELVGGRYLDSFECRGVEWRIARRQVVLDWQSVSDGSGMEERLAGGQRGRRDGRDPSY